MKRQLITTALSLSLVLSTTLAFATDAQAPVKKMAISKLSMAEKGRFHDVHLKKAETACDDCHTKGELPPDTVMLRLHDPLAKGDPGPVNHETCFDCHSWASKPLPFYAKKK